MDFESYKWDVENEAEKLHHSLFGDSKEMTSLKKRKRKKDSLDVTDHKKHKKSKHDLLGHDLFVKSNDKSYKQKRKDNHLKVSHVETSFIKGNSVHTQEKSQLDCNKLKNDQPKQKGKSSGNLETQSVEVDKGVSVQKMENKVRKKKRKRKCKKNKFKDYSNPENVLKGENVSVESNILSAPGFESETSISKSRMVDQTEKITDKLDTKLKHSNTNDESKSEFRPKKKKQQIEKLKSDRHNSSVKYRLNTDLKNVSEDGKTTKLHMKNATKNIKNSLETQKLPAILKEDILLKTGLSTPASSSNVQNKKSSTKHIYSSLDSQILQAMLKEKPTLKTNSESPASSNNVNTGSRTPARSSNVNTGARTPAGSSGYNVNKESGGLHKVPESLLEKSRRRLNAARFRYINEQLYTTSGSEALQMFDEDRDAFLVYHEGFQAQVEKWPINPVDIIIDYLKSKPENLVVADFGCGDAKLAQNVPNKVHSFDLVSLNHHVTACDMANVPLKDSSIDIAVFCLSLMGTNLSSYLLEANRVLKHKGILKIAEVTSRFRSIGSFVLKVEKMGFKIIDQDSSNKMFVMMDFKKTSSVKNQSAAISLDPCVYKKR